jgi:PAS domain S-box-containing protein
LRRAHEELQVRSEELAVANEELQAQSTQLQESEQRLRLALEGGRMGCWEWDLVTDTMFWCARTYELLGLETFMRARVETLLDCIHPDERQAMKSHIAQVMNEATDFQAEFRVLCPRHEPRCEVVWLALHARVVRDAQERAVRAIGVVYDVTARRQMEAELRRLNERLEEEVQAQTTELRDVVDRLQEEVARRVLVEGELRENSRLLEAFFRHTITPLAFLDRHLNFVRVNEAFARADGKAPAFFVQKNYFLLYPSAENRVLFEQVVRTREPYHGRARLCAFCNPQQQTLKYWNWHVTPLLDEAEQVQFLVFNLADVSEQQKAFGELEHRAHLLQKLTLELAQAEDRERGFDPATLGKTTGFGRAHRRADGHGGSRPGRGWAQSHRADAGIAARRGDYGRRHADHAGR